MKIAIDARMMGAGQSRGIGRYIEELVRALLKISANEQYILLVKNTQVSPFLNHPRVEHVQADISWYGWKEQLQMPRVLDALSVDLLHIPHWNVPLLTALIGRLPYVVTIHDLILMHQASQKSTNITTRHPLYARLKRVGYRLTLAQTIRRARAVLVPTQFVARDVKAYFPHVETTVTSEGVTRFDTQSLSSARPMKEPFLLYVGSAYPHKRLDLLLEVWPRIQRVHPEMKLVIAGRLDAFMQCVQADAMKMGQSGIEFPGHLTDVELASYLQTAAAFIFPSSDEGMGLPPLEALSMSCPVVASDASCLPEVLTRPGVSFFRNGDADDIIRAIEHALSEKERTDAQESAASIALEFSWEKTAASTLAAYYRTVKT